MPVSKQSWTLLAIANAGSEGLTPAQLQKSLFLLKKTFPQEFRNFYQFVPYNYGPFDKNIYSDARELEAQGFVRIDGNDEQNWSKYYITPLGVETTNKLKETEEAATINYLDKVVKWAQSLSFTQLIASIYKSYPEYRVNSVFRDQ